MNSSNKNIVLLGMGHTNLEIIRLWESSAIKNYNLICISDYVISSYSGMLPGVIAGYFGEDEMTVDLINLASKSNAQLVQDETIGLDLKKKQLILKNTRPVEFEILSIGVGSTIKDLGTNSENQIIQIKPMQTFLKRLDVKLLDLINKENKTPNVVILGGGAAGIEIAFSIKRKLETDLKFNNSNISVVDSYKILGANLNKRTRKIINRLFSENKIEVYSNQVIISFENGYLISKSNQKIPADLVISTTGAEPLDLLAKLNLPLSKDGFISTKSTLRSVSDLPIFAVGDCGSIINQEVPKAGVYAVKEAPILWGNINAVINNQELKEYFPQNNFLKIINTSNGRAILEYKFLTFYGSWCNKLKTYIDKKFIRKYQ